MNQDDEHLNEDHHHTSKSSICNVQVEQSRFVTVHLDEEIKGANYYRQVVDLLAQLQKEDTVQFLINSGGGDYYGMTSIVEAIKNTEANVVGVILGMAASAASIIAMQCPTIVVCDSAIMMIHSLSYGIYGKESDVRSYTQFMTKQTDKLIRSTYDGFLTKQEIEQVIQGAEIWMDADEIRNRLENKQKQFLRKQKQQNKTSTRNTSKPTQENITEYQAQE